MVLLQNVLSLAYTATKACPNPRQSTLVHQTIPPRDHEGVWSGHETTSSLRCVGYGGHHLEFARQLFEAL